MTSFGPSNASRTMPARGVQNFSNPCYVFPIRGCARPDLKFSWLQRGFKRGFDLVVALLVLSFGAPLFLMIALAIRCESQGGVIFRQQRRGRCGALITVYKFRTMYLDCSDANASHQTCRNDDRVTKVGRILRRTSLDELPQFVNVLRGTMSVVGPRPHALRTSVCGLELPLLEPHYAKRYCVKPGITGLAQVEGWRGELTDRETLRARIALDLIYVATWTVWLDLVIVARTFALVLRDKNAF